MSNDKEKQGETTDAPAEKRTKEDASALNKGEASLGETKDEGAEVEIPKEFKALIEQIEKMSVMELHELVKVMEKRFGVSAQAVAVAAPAGGGAEGADEEQDSFTVELKDAGGQKIAVIKAVKEILGLGLKEAKDLVDGVPSVLKEGVKKEEVEEIKAKIEAAGGTIELK
jgi:large subunit ribosomal protein L7/L12